MRIFNVGAKTLALFVLVISIIINLTACGGLTPVSKGEVTAKKSVITTIFPAYDIVKSIARDNVDLKLLLPPGADTHTFEPTPQDILAISKCDLFIYAGGEGEVWVERVLSSVSTKNAEIIALSDYVTLQEIEHTDESSHDDEIDWHIWTSPKNMEIFSEIITERLLNLGLTPEQCDENYKNYKTGLSELDERFRNVVESGKRKTLVFADRFPFLYFAKEYGLEHYAAFPGCTDSTEPSAQTVRLLISVVKSEDIPVFFYLEMSSTKLADTISEATGAVPMLFHSCHNVTKDEFDSGKTYIELMHKNADNLELALG
jgi:zinc transport system substrate-binding protein